MTAISIPTPFPIFTGTDGFPLEDGYIYVGVQSVNPITNPKPVYWDSAMTIPAAQPIRTSGGYAVRNGSPARVYVDGYYSIIVRNKNGELVFSKLSVEPDVQLGAEYVPFTPAGTGAVVGSSQSKMRESVSVFDFMTAAQIADVQSGTLTLDATTAIQAAIDSIRGSTANPFNPNTNERGGSLHFR